MGFLDKAKAAAETAANKAKEGVDDVQTKRALGHAYEQLGRTAYGLVQSSAISHADLTAGTAEIEKLEAHLAEEDAPAPAPAAAAPEPAAAAAPAEPAAAPPA
jgi:hypothetical protein